MCVFFAQSMVLIYNLKTNLSIANKKCILVILCKSVRNGEREGGSETR